MRELDINSMIRDASSTDDKLTLAYLKSALVMLGNHARGSLAMSDTKAVQMHNKVHAAVQSLPSPFSFEIGSALNGKMSDIYVTGELY